MNNPNITHAPLNPKGALQLGFIPCGWCKDAPAEICLTPRCNHFKRWVDIKQREWDEIAGK